MSNTNENRFTFNAESFICNGRTFPCGYSVTESGKAFVFADVNGQKIRFEVERNHPDYESLVAVATAEKHFKPVLVESVVPIVPVPDPDETPCNHSEPIPEPTPEPTPEPIPETPCNHSEPIPEPTPEPIPEPTPEPTPENDTVSQLKALIEAQNAKIAALEALLKSETPSNHSEPAKTPSNHSENVEKPHVEKSSFVGTEIVGNGWKIIFDEKLDRTRVIFSGTPSAAQKNAIDEAGFFWSNAMKSFNKRLTVKAYRAALDLAETLKKNA